ncbi:MAG: hypothetical protein H6Q99_332 [Proteobacteria bacterium]|nr:hypothetical protein [Pseudomonadota bacterium]
MAGMLTTFAGKLFSLLPDGMTKVGAVLLVDKDGNPIGASGGLVSEAAGAVSTVSGPLATAGDAIIIPLAGFNGAVFAFSGVFTGLGGAFEASYNDGANYVAVSAVSVGGGSPVTTVSSLAAAAAYEVYAAGATHVRFRVTAISTGPAAAIARPFVFAADPAPGVAGGTLTLSAISSSSNTIIGDVSNSPRTTSGGLSSLNRLLSAIASTNATLVKGAAGRLYKARGYNAAAAVRYLKLYNKASAPTVGTDTPVVTLPLAPSAVFDIDLVPIGQYFSTGIAFALTTGSADSDTGAVAAGDVVGLALWYA